MASQDVAAALTLIIDELPVLEAAYSALRTIYSAANPAMTEDDYKARLRQVSAEGESFTSGWLIAHGYVQGADGSWSKPPAP